MVTMAKDPSLKPEYWKELQKMMKKRENRRHKDEKPRYR